MKLTESANYKFYKLPHVRRRYKTTIATYKVSTREEDGINKYTLNGEVVSHGLCELPIGTTVTFTGIPSGHPLQILDPSSNASGSGATPTLEYTFNREGSYSMNCTYHGLMGGKDVFLIVI